MNEQKRSYFHSTTKKKQKKVSVTSEPCPANFSFLANGLFYHSGSHIGNALGIIGTLHEQYKELF